MKKKIKWPTWLMLIRHDTSEFNMLKNIKEKDPLYKKYLAAREKDDSSNESILLAKLIMEKFSIKESDAETKLADKDGKQAYRTGIVLAKDFELPDVVFVSPYLRTLETLRHIGRGWNGLENVKTYKEDRLREQDHGIASLYNDWKIFHTLNPEQRKLNEKEGRYYYRFPQGENVPDVRLRNLSWLSTLTRDFAGKKVLVVTHHLNILAMRANLERFDDEKFRDLDENHKPINSGVTLYRCNPDKGTQGKIELDYYNKKFY